MIFKASKVPLMFSVFRYRELMFSNLLTVTPLMMCDGQSLQNQYCGITIVISSQS